MKSNSKGLALLPFPTATQMERNARLAEIAHGHGLTIDTCAEKVDWQEYGIEQIRCIFRKLNVKGTVFIQYAPPKTAWVSIGKFETANLLGAAYRKKMLERG